MNHATLHLTLLFLMLLAYSGARAANNTDLDLITMKNGDIHNARVQQEHFTIETGHGEISIPYPLMEHLATDSRQRQQKEIVRTRPGDRFSGRIRQRMLTILRPGEPDLRISLEDIDEIIFAQHKTAPQVTQPPDTVELHNGDLFAARIDPEALHPQQDSSGAAIENGAIKFIDLVRSLDGDMVRAQFSLHSGERIMGRITGDTISVTTRHGNKLSLPPGDISAITLRVNSGQTRPSYNYRQKFDPANYLRDRMLDGNYGPEMIKLPGGSYYRGDHMGDGDDDEQPTREIKLHPFAIGLYEITFDEYDRFCEQSGHDKPDDSEWGRGRRPAINVSWEEAKEFTEWLSRKTGKRYRLPTDAEWEYAARAGTESRFWWGDDAGKSHANCENCGGLWDGEMTAPVGRFAPNPFGLHDTAGNVFEWVADCHHDTFAEAPADGSAIEKEGCGKRVIRGGAWSFPPRELRSANRWRDFPTRRSDDTGFRVLRELDQPGSH